MEAGVKCVLMQMRGTLVERCANVVRMTPTGIMHNKITLHSLPPCVCVLFKMERLWPEKHTLPPTPACVFPHKCWCGIVVVCVRI